MRVNTGRGKVEFTKGLPRVRCGSVRPTSGVFMWERNERTENANDGKKLFITYSSDYSRIGQGCKPCCLSQSRNYSKGSRGPLFGQLSWGMRSMALVVTSHRGARDPKASEP